MLINFDADEMDQLKTTLTALDIPNVSIQQSGIDYLEITHKAAKNPKASTISSKITKLTLKKLQHLATPIAIKIPTKPSSTGKTRHI